MACCEFPPNAKHLLQRGQHVVPPCLVLFQEGNSECKGALLQLGYGTSVLFVYLAGGTMRAWQGPHLSYAWDSQRVQHARVQRAKQ